MKPVDIWNLTKESHEIKILEHVSLWMWAKVSVNVSDLISIEERAGIYRQIMELTSNGQEIH